MTTKLFSELGISEDSLKAINRLGYEKATPIQAETIPLLMQGKDIVGQSQTGSGKTAAFGIPAIEMIDPQNRAVQALILAPTRELAVQVSEELHKLAFFKKGIHVLPIYGGQSYDRQFYGLKQGANIVIGTPGRLMDHMRRGTLKLDQVKMVVLDEADVMLDMGFREDIEFILKGVPPARQTVFFSATISKVIQQLIQTYARDPQTIRMEQKTMTVTTVEQMYYEVDRRFKVELLTRLIDIHDLKLGIIFCNTKRMVDELVDHLNAQGYSADRLHGDMTQAMRDRVMNKFRKSGLEFLVATDVAARGIDVDDVQVVFNYDLPYDVEDYVHRIGRTGRAGRSGRAISFVAGRELFQIQQIERYTKTRIHRAKIPTVTEVEQARSNVFIAKLRATLQSGEYKKQDHLIEILLEEGFTSTDIASALIHHLQNDDSKPAGDTETSPSNRQDRGDRGDRGDRPPREERFERDRDQRRPRFERPQQDRPPQRLHQPMERPAAPVRAARPPLQPFERPDFNNDKPPRPAASKAIEPPTLRPKEPRRVQENHIRLHLNVGREMDVSKEELLRAIQGETGVPPGSIGTVDMRDRHSFVDVKSEHAKAIVSKLNRVQIKNLRLKVKMRSDKGGPE
jgi:ATP-dependent RNA helicase DeaD